jgi:hypothetical protein
MELSFEPKLTTEAVDKAPICAALNKAKACVLIDTMLAAAMALTCWLLSDDTWSLRKPAISEDFNLEIVAVLNELTEAADILVKIEAI